MDRKYPPSGLKGDFDDFVAYSPSPPSSPRPERPDRERKYRRNVVSPAGDGLVIPSTPLLPLRRRREIKLLSPTLPPSGQLGSRPTRLGERPERPNPFGKSLRVQSPGVCLNRPSLPRIHGHESLVERKTRPSNGHLGLEPFPTNHAPGYFPSVHPKEQYVELPKIVPTKCEEKGTLTAHHFSGQLGSGPTDSEERPNHFGQSRRAPSPSVFQRRPSTPTVLGNESLKERKSRPSKNDLKPFLTRHVPENIPSVRPGEKYAGLPEINQKEQPADQQPSSPTPAVEDHDSLHARKAPYPSRKSLEVLFIKPTREKVPRKLDTHGQFSVLPDIKGGSSRIHEDDEDTATGQENSPVSHRENKKGKRKANGKDQHQSPNGLSKKERRGRSRRQ